MKKYLLVESSEFAKAGVSSVVEIIEYRDYNPRKDIIIADDDNAEVLRAHPRAPKDGDPKRPFDV